MSKSEIAAAIGVTPRNGQYLIRHHIPGESFECIVPNISIGNAIVTELRRRAASLTATWLIEVNYRVRSGLRATTVEVAADDAIAALAVARKHVGQRRGVIKIDQCRTLGTFLLKHHESVSSLVRY